MKYNFGDVYKVDDNYIVILRNFPGMKNALVAPIDRTKFKRTSHVKVNMYDLVNYKTWILIEYMRFVENSKLDKFVKKISDKELIELDKCRKVYGF